MEMGTALIIVSVIFAVPGSLFTLLHYRKNTQIGSIKVKKQREDVVQTLVSQSIRDLQEAFSAREKIMKDEILGLQKSNARYKGMMRKINEEQLDQYEEDDSKQTVNIQDDYDIDWVKAVQVGQQLGLDTKTINPNNPVLTGYIKDKILENKDLALFMGILKPKGSITNTGNQPGPSNVTSGSQNIFDSPEAQNFQSL